MLPQPQRKVALVSLYAASNLTQDLCALTDLVEIILPVLASTAWPVFDEGTKTSAAQAAVWKGRAVDLWLTRPISFSN